MHAWLSLVSFRQIDVQKRNENNFVLYLLLVHRKKPCFRAEVFCYCIKQKDSILPRVCSVIDHRRTQNYSMSCKQNTTSSKYARMMYPDVNMTVPPTRIIESANFHLFVKKYLQFGAVWSSKNTVYEIKSLFLVR